MVWDDAHRIGVDLTDLGRLTLIALLQVKDIDRCSTVAAKERAMLYTQLGGPRFYARAKPFVLWKPDDFHTRLLIVNVKLALGHYFSEQGSHQVGLNRMLCGDQRFSVVFDVEARHPTGYGYSPRSPTIVPRPAKNCWLTCKGMIWRDQD